jgi:hypothetical protein
MEKGYDAKKAEQLGIDRNCGCNCHGGDKDTQNFY